MINEALIMDGKPYSPRRREHLKLLSGVSQALEMLVENDYEIIVVTNQPDVARGFLAETELSEIHQLISISTGIKHFYSCLHDDHDNCKCRKPKSGLLRRAADELELNLSMSYLVGDRRKDILAGQEFGCTCFFIDNNYEEEAPPQPFYTVTSLLEAAQLIVEGQNVR